MFLFSIVFSAVLQQAAADGVSPQVQTKTVPRKTEQTNARVINSVVDLQINATKEVVTIPASEKQEGEKSVKIPERVLELTNLNPTIGSWFVLSLQMGRDKKTYHVELQMPETDQLQISAMGLKISRAEGLGTTEVQCESIDESLIKQILADQKNNLSYTEICEKRAVIRHQITGRQTAKEFVSGFLRDNLWGGEQITTAVKETFFQDKYLLSATPEKEVPGTKEQVSSNEPKPFAPPSPGPARIDQNFQGNTLAVSEFGIKLAGNPEKMTVGKWYSIEGQPGMFASVLESGMVDKGILASNKGVVGNLDNVESKAVVLLIAFKKNEFEVGFMIGTDHPRVDWSERALESVIDKSKPGPDGIGTIAPLVGTGKVIPANVPRTVASFIGGFKRSHSAFKWGTFAGSNSGSHYGFIEQGVILSKLIPGLSTILINNKNEMSLKTWTKEDETALLPTIKHARQNGVPLIDGIETLSVPVVNQAATPDVSLRTLPIPGALVNRWGPGNWSGSIDSKLRALRAGLCQQPQDGGDFFIYGYFSTATPNAMARVFQAYGCDHAIHLDMNALEHTYFAVYEKSGENFVTQHLIKGMHVLDSKFQGKSLPRFLGSADNRDFFYLMRK